ncbi:MAG TPA: UvrD-helicase domain-containing protein [Edaphobacter sp.]|nr:UvrD-helicase domain-containing protein [Edaphobacter sp.]
MAEVISFGSLAESANQSKKTHPSDWREREQALDITQSWIVEAPAGSGKTGLLIQRYLKLLGEANIEQPEQILAITFTVKATGEIRERILAQLESTAQNAPLKDDSDFERQTRALALAVLQRDRALHWGLLDRPRRLKIQTIDSICMEIASSLPVLSGSSGKLSPVLNASPLYHEAARRTLMQLGGDDAALSDALRTVLLHRDGNLADCENLLAQMLELRGQWGKLVPLRGHELDDDYLDQTVLPRLERALEQAICAGLKQLSANVPDDFLVELSALASSMAHLPPYQGDISPIAGCAGKDAPGIDAEHLEQWRGLIHLLVTGSRTYRRRLLLKDVGFEITKEQQQQLKDLIDRISHRDDLLEAMRHVDSLPPAQYPPEQWTVAKALFRVLSRALVELQLLFAQRGECDFAELGLLAKAALNSAEGIHDLEAALGMRLQHLLVDEMQDTSTDQYELIELLTQGWDGHSQTVFLVGDPKQSIYRFRQARVERFVQTMLEKRLGDLPVGCLRLTANFRSQRGLVDTFNQDFSLIFPSELSASSPEEVEYVSASPVREKSAAAGVVWHGNLLPPRAQGSDPVRLRKWRSRLDSSEIREIIETWRARPLPANRTEPWKIAVLVRVKHHLAGIIAEFKKDTGTGPIPFRAVEIDALSDRQEVLDLFALTRALLHPADRVAWLAVLHAPWCGLGAAALHVIAGADDDRFAKRTIGTLIAERKHLLDEDSRAHLERVMPVFQAAAEQRGRLAVAQLVERTWRSLHGDIYLTAEQMSNAHRYLQLLDEIEQETGTLDLSLLKARLNDLCADTAMRADAVDLMTIHKAKGLEWDVVIVPSLEKSGRASRRRLLTWHELDSEDATAANIVLAPIPGKGEESRELNDWLNGIERNRDAAERKRLFYVACTRAKEELHLFANPELTKSGQIRDTASLLNAAWPAAEKYLYEIALPPSADVLGPGIEEEPLSIAAAAEDKPPMIQRLPLDLSSMPSSTITRLPYGDSGVHASIASFQQPQGSFEVRAVGNTVHAFLESIAKQLAGGTDAEQILRQIGSWRTRIAAVLRSDGFAAEKLDQLALRVMRAMGNTLRDPNGLWILSAQTDASSELALTSWEDTRRSVRLDRTFRAGATPQSTGNDFLWIVDYKTAEHQGSGLDEFLREERERYKSQMESYAHMMQHDTAKLRFGLYYPMLSQLVWWSPESESL